MEFLERTIKRIYEDENGALQKEEKQIKDVIDTENEAIKMDNGNYIIRKTGIQKMADYVGAVWRKPEIVDTPNINNGKGFYVISECVFPDGSVNYAPGESSEKNNKIVDKYMFITAVNRANAASFLRSPYMGLYDAYSDEEADEFEKEVSQSKNNRKNEQLNKKIQEMQKKYNTIISKMSKYVALPDADEEYPKAYIHDLWDVHQDIEYLEKIANTSESDELRFVARTKLKEVKEAEMKEETELEKEKTENE